MSAIGLRVGPFEIIEEAEVPEVGPWYAARRTGASRKGPADVLVRLLPPDATPAMRVQAQTAYESLRILDDKRIPAAVGWFEGTAAMAVTASQGPTLDDFLVARAEGRVDMTPPTLLDIAVELTEALQHAHQRGIVHGHLTPGSIVIAPDGGLWVWGFGEGPQSPVPPHWLPPERARGEPSSAATDQWSLAALLVGLVTGNEPWPGADPEGLARSGDSPRIVAPVLAQWPALGRLLARMLDREPSARFPNLHPPRTELLAMVRKAGGTSSRRALAVQLTSPSSAIAAEDAPPAPRLTMKPKAPLPNLLRGFSPSAEHAAATRTTDPRRAKISSPPDSLSSRPKKGGKPIVAEPLAVVQPDLGDDLPVAKKGESRGRLFAPPKPPRVPPLADLSAEDFAEDATTDGNLKLPPEPMLGPSLLDAPSLRVHEEDVEDVDIGLQPDAALEGMLGESPEDIDNLEDSPTTLHLPTVLLRTPTSSGLVSFAAQPVPGPMHVSTDVKRAPTPAPFSDPGTSVTHGEPFIDLRTAPPARPPAPSTPPWESALPSTPPWQAVLPSTPPWQAAPPSTTPWPATTSTPPWQAVPASAAGSSGSSVSFAATPEPAPSSGVLVIDGRDRGPTRPVEDQLDDTRDDVTSPPVLLVTNDSRAIIVALAPWIVVGACFLAVLWFIWMLV